ncbi:hypothetical protein LCGC14_2851420 [marine sediment metagenome]|uniref:Uncharacterized protein n=1 Tax=marine sediment metagenome TaxID=412755 RepID=A0A0F8Y8F4_9ZZZZ
MPPITPPSIPRTTNAVLNDIVVYKRLRCRVISKTFEENPRFGLRVEQTGRVINEVERRDFNYYPPEQKSCH